MLHSFGFVFHHFRRLPELQVNLPHRLCPIQVALFETTGLSLTCCHLAWLLLLGVGLSCWCRQAFVVRGKSWGRARGGRKMFADLIMKRHITCQPRSLALSTRSHQPSRYSLVFDDSPHNLQKNDIAKDASFTIPSPRWRHHPVLCGWVCAIDISSLCPGPHNDTASF